MLRSDSCLFSYKNSSLVLIIIISQVSISWIFNFKFIKNNFDEFENLYY